MPRGVVNYIISSLQNSKVPGPSPKGTAIKMKKILVIDDENFYRTFTRESLEGVGYEVVEAEDGAEGIKKAKKELPDLILLDIVMPGMDGIEVCGELMKIENVRDIPVLMYTSQDEAQLIKIALDTGAADYIIKPANDDQLLARVRINLRLKQETDRRKEYEQKLIKAHEEIKRLGGTVDEEDEIIDLMEEI